jgi:hypothetical protein
MRFERGKPDGGTASGTDGRPSFSNTVPRELVHRPAISEIFMTDIHRISEGRYLAAAKWPRLHPFFHSGGGAYDTALIAESLRQATILLAHAMEGVPLGQVFLMPDLAVQSLGSHASEPGTPAEVHVVLDASVSRRNADGAGALRIKARFDVGGRAIATGTAGARLVDPASYARMRLRAGTDGRSPQTAATPRSVRRVVCRRIRPTNAQVRNGQEFSQFGVGNHSRQEDRPHILDPPQDISTVGEDA